MNRADLMLSVLRSEPRPFSRQEIFQRVGFMLTNNAASELRARGFGVEATQRTLDGKTTYLYRLVSEPAPCEGAGTDGALDRTSGSTLTRYEDSSDSSAASSQSAEHTDETQLVLGGVAA